MSSDLKRRYDDSKRSVFERLGPDTKSTSINNNTVNSKIPIKMPSVCPSYTKTGYCQLGSKCKYEHVKRDKEKDDTKSRTIKRTDVEKVNDHPKEADIKLKSTIVSKSSDDYDKKGRKVTESSTKTLKPSERSSSPSDSRKRKLEDHEQIKQKGRKLQNEPSKEDQHVDQKFTKSDDKSSDKSSSKQKKVEPAVKNYSSVSGKKSQDNILLPSSSKHAKPSEVEKISSKEIQPRGHSRHNENDIQKLSSKSKSESSRKDDKREPKKTVEPKDKRDVKSSTDLLPPSSSNSSLKVQRNPSPAKVKDGSGSKAKTKGKHQSMSESTSSSSSSGSSSSSSGSSSGSSSRSSYTSHENDKQKKRREVHDDRKAKQNPEKNRKVAIKKSDDGDKRTSDNKHTRECSDDRVGERSEDRVKRSKQKVESSQGSKRECSKSPSPRFNLPVVKGRDGHYYSSRKQTEDERYAKGKIPDYEKGNPDRSHDGRRTKSDKSYPDKISPGVEPRRKESDYFKREEFDRYNRRAEDDYESVERRKSSRDRSMYDASIKDAIYDEPMRRLSRRGQWEQLEADDVMSKHKRHLSNESYSPARKKKRPSPLDDYRERGDKIYETESRKREYEREDSLMDDIDYKHQRRSSHDSWHQHTKEKRQRRDKSDHDRSRERGRDDYYARSPLGSSDYSPRHRTEHGKRSGDFSGGYDYDVERGGRSPSRSSMGSKPAGRSRYYEGKRSVGVSGATIIPSLYPPSYEFRDSYRATPEVEALEGRGFSGKPLYWDDYKRPEGPPSGSSYRGTSNRQRPGHPSAPGPSVDWEGGRMPGKPHDWEARYERSSEEFMNRRDVLLPPPPRSRHENSEIPSPAPPTNSILSVPIEAPSTPTLQPLKPMNFELEGYEEVTEEEMEDCLAEEDGNNDTGIEKDGGHMTYEDEAESLPRKIPLVEMSDIEWESLVESDDSKTKVIPRPAEQNFVEIMKEIGVSRQFAGEELFEKISIRLMDGDDKVDEGDVKVTEDCYNGGDNNDDDEEEKKLKPVLSVNGDICEEKMEVKENGEANSTPETWPDEATRETDLKSKGCDNRVDGKENKMEAFDYGLTTSTPPLQKNKRGLLHDAANFQVTAFLKKERQVSAMRDIGPYRRALCARRDLAIRRTLCRIEKDEIVMFPAQLADQELYKLSLQLYQQNGKVTQENVVLTLA